MTERYVCPHDDRCGGYGGWWTDRLDGGNIGWAVDPKDEYDGVGYAMCSCMAESPTNT